MDPPTECFHCGEALAGRTPLRVRLRDTEAAVCCPGCRAAAQLISELGLEDFYRFRTAPPVKPAASSDSWSAYDEPALLDSLSRRDTRGRAVILSIDGLTCAACSWLIKRSLTGSTALCTRASTARRGARRSCGTKAGSSSRGSCRSSRSSATGLTWSRRTTRTPWRRPNGAAC